MITKEQEAEIRKVLSDMPLLDCCGHKIAYWWVMTRWKAESVIGERNLIEIATVIDINGELAYGLPSNNGGRMPPAYNPPFELIGHVEHPSKEMMIALYYRENKLNDYECKNCGYKSSTSIDSQPPCQKCKPKEYEAWVEQQIIGLEDCSKTKVSKA